MRKVVVLSLVATITLLACSCALPIPGTQRATPTALRQESTSTPQPSPTISTVTASPVLTAATPTLGRAELRLAAVEMTSGAAQEGWVTYVVRLAIENRGSQALTWSSLYFPVRGVEPGEVQTEGGYSYEVEWRPRAVMVDQEFTCVWPLEVTGRRPIPVVPPGFLISGTIGLDSDTGEICVAKPRVSFTIGETLRPVALTLGQVQDAAPPVDLQDQIGELTYPLVDPSQGFDALPAIVQMGQAWVAITEASPGSDGSTVFSLSYENRDPGQSHDCTDPVVAVIDSRGVATDPSLPLDVWPAEHLACPSAVKPDHKALGPLQEAEYQTCVSWDAGGPVFPIYLVLRGHTGEWDPVEGDYYVYEIRGY